MRFKLGIRKSFLIAKVIKHRNRLHEEYPSLEAYKRRLEKCVWTVQPWGWKGGRPVLILVLASGEHLHFLNANLMAVTCCCLCSTSTQVTWSKYFVYWCVQTPIEGLFLQVASLNVRNTWKMASKQTPWFTPWYEVSLDALQELGSRWHWDVLVFICRKKPSRRVQPTFVITSMILLGCLPARFCLDEIFS